MWPNQSRLVLDYLFTEYFLYCDRLSGSVIQFHVNRLTSVYLMWPPVLYNVALCSTFCLPMFKGVWIASFSFFRSEENSFNLINCYFNTFLPICTKIQLGKPPIAYQFRINERRHKNAIRNRPILGTSITRASNTKRICPSDAKLLFLQDKISILQYC